MQDKKTTTTIRIGQESMSFSVTDANAIGGVATEPYDMNLGISMAANLREAFTTSEVLGRDCDTVLVMVDSPVMLVPLEEWEQDDEAEQSSIATAKYDMYHHTFSDVPKGDIIVSSILAELNVVAVYSVNKDVNTVVCDHYRDVRFAPMGMPVWQEMYRSRGTRDCNKLFVYFQDSRMEVFSFHQNRFRFYNCFSAAHAHDALYYILYIWKQLALNTEHDELHIIGKPVHKEWLEQEINEYIRHAHYHREI